MPAYLSDISSARPADVVSASTPAADPLRGYTGAEFVFASPTTSLIASDFVLDLPAADPHDMRGGAEAVNDLFARARELGIDQPLLVGAVPFDVTTAPRLSIARTCRREGSGVPTPLAAPTTVAAPTSAAAPTTVAASASVAAPTSTSAPSPSPYNAVHVASQEPRPAASVYEAAVTEALARFERGDLGKVVLSRTLALSLDGPLHLPSLMAMLLAKNTRGFTYAVPLATPGEVFLGATPELLVRRMGARVTLNPLAGSAARRVDAQEDRAAGQALMASAKDLQEHAIVIDAIAKVLRPLCRTLSVPARPELIATDALWHLSTVIEGELIDPATTSLDLAFALHPTPAVCGYPTQAAFDTIMSLEPFDRGFFAGFVGWMDASGDGEWAVSLRCALCGPAHATLYAGAGIVPGSVPARETAETQTKFRTMLSALGLDQSIDQG